MVEEEHAQGCSHWLHQTGHILDTENVNSFRDKLVHKVEIVVQSVLRPILVGDVSTVANDCLANTTSLLGRIDTELHLQRI